MLAVVLRSYWLQSQLRGRNDGCLACCTLVLQGRGHPQRHVDEGCGIGGCRLGNGTCSEYIAAPSEAQLQYRADAFAPVFDIPALEHGGALRAHLKCLCASGMFKNIKTRSLSAQGQGPARALLSFTFLPLHSRLTQHLRASIAMAWLGAGSGTGWQWLGRVRHDSDNVPFARMCFAPPHLRVIPCSRR